jgi:hypothetical protein
VQRADSVYFIAILALRVLAHETDTLRAELARHHAHVPAQSAADASCAPVASENEHVSRANLIYPLIFALAISSRGSDAPVSAFVRIATAA